MCIKGDIMNIKEIIESRLKVMDISQTDMCRTLGIADGTLSTWKARNSIGKKHLEAVAKYLGVSPNLLLWMDTNGVSKIPLVSSASCGVGGKYYDDCIDFIEVPKEYAIDGNYAVTADGDSMYPDIRDGDYVICSTTEPVKSGDIAHYCYDDTSGVKKVFIDQDLVTLIPTNQAYHPLTIREEITLHKCIGRFSKL